METPKFWWEVNFCQQDFSRDEGREKKSQGTRSGE